MSTEETHVELKEDATDPVQTEKDAADPVKVQVSDANNANNATEADVSETNLDQEKQAEEKQENQEEGEDEEKQPMTGANGGGEDEPLAPPEEQKNGAVKLKIPDEEEDEEEEEEEENNRQKGVKFTGLSKEELLRVAGTPGWIRMRVALLVLFWLCWLGMLGGAVLIILKAPPCREIPASDWWNDGPLYQLGDLQAFTDTGDLKGVEQKINTLSKLKLKGLVVARRYTWRLLMMSSTCDSWTFSPEMGNMEDFQRIIKSAHRKSIFVVLDLTPNYRGTGAWFSNSSINTVAENLKSALVFWMDKGVDGFQLSGAELVAEVVPLLWSDIRAIVQNSTNQGEEPPKKRVLIGVTDRSKEEEVSSLLTSLGVDLLISKILLPVSLSPDATEHAQCAQRLYATHGQRELAWSFGGPGAGHLASLVGPNMVKFYQMLTLTLPGTPVFNYGDEIGLMDQDTKFPKMIWDSEEELNGTLQEERLERLSFLQFFRFVSDLKIKERSLNFGEFHLLFDANANANANTDTDTNANSSSTSSPPPPSPSSSSMAFLRVWDQSPRFIAVFNFANESQLLDLQLQPQLRAQLQNDANLKLLLTVPSYANVVVATDGVAMPTDTTVALNALKLGPKMAALLKFPYTG